MALTREQLAQRVAQELQDGYYVNLGIGIPTLVANYIPEGIEVMLQSENGLLDMGQFPTEDEIDADLIEGEEFLTFNLKVHHEEKVVKTKLIGTYNLSNSLCAAAIGYEFGLSFDEIVKGLEDYQPDNNRSELKKTEKNREKAYKYIEQLHSIRNNRDIELNRMLNTFQ